MRGLFIVIPVSSPVATFEQSENIAIAHLGQTNLICCCSDMVKIGASDRKKKKKKAINWVWL